MSAELGKAYVQIMPSAKGIAGSVQKELNGEMGDAGGLAGESLGASLVGKLKAVIISAGIGTFLKQSIMEGADLQQSMGGIDTLFKDSADKMKQYASEAFQTVGISANDYMEQATSFSASLLQSMGGDTAKAADVANMALMDMGDNANKFGTDMSSIQNAYQGFAKQNYTMLDNLKLGYGGTKEEMSRLLADAEKLTGVHYDISNLSDVYSAIHAVQEELGVTGATADEAKTTFSGSFAAMKAAASDLMGNLALGENVAPQLSNLLETARVFLLDNFLPMVGNIVTGIPEAIGTMFASNPEGFAGAASSFIEQLHQGITTNLPQMLETAKGIVSNISEGITTNLPILLQSGLELVGELALGAIQSIPDLLSMAAELIHGVQQGIADSLPGVLESGIEIVVELINGLLDKLPDILETAWDIMDNMVETILSVDWIGLGSDVLTMVTDGIESIASTLWETVKRIATTALDRFHSGKWKETGSKVINLMINGIKEIAESLWTNVKKLASDALEKFKGVDWKETGKKAINLIIEGIKFLFVDIPNLLKEIGEKAGEAMGDVDWLQVGEDIINGIVAGLKAVGGAIIDFLLGIAEEALDQIKSFFGIESPSKVMREEVGKMLPEGMALGIRANADDVKKAMEDLSGTAYDATVNDPVYASLMNGAGAPGLAMARNADEQMGQVVNLLKQYLPECAIPPVIDGNSIVDYVDDRMQANASRLEAVYA